MTFRVILQDETTGEELNWTLSLESVNYLRTFLEKTHGDPVRTQLSSLTRTEADGSSFKIEYPIGE